MPLKKAPAPPLGPFFIWATYDAPSARGTRNLKSVSTDPSEREVFLAERRIMIVEDETVKRAV